MKQFLSSICVLCLTSVTLLFAQPESVSTSVALKLDLPVFDLPYQIDAAGISGYNFLDSYTHPGMDLSLNIATDAISSFHYGMAKLKDIMGTDKYWKRFAYYGGSMLGDLALFVLPAPPSQIWMHEAFHGAAFTYGGIGNHIGYNFPVAAYTVPDFGDFTHWYDWSRTLAAGFEGQHLLIEKMQMNNFFHEQKMFNEFYYWLTFYQTWDYAYSPFIQDQITLTVDGEEQEAAGDSLLWAYFLFHPEKLEQDTSDEDVKITLSSLKDNEKKFLKTRTMLSLLNFASPMMFGIRSIPLGKDSGVYGNFALRHFYTSFGTDSSVDIYLKHAHYNFKFVLHNYINYEHYFPAVEAALVDFPLSFGGLNILLSPRILLGVQPRDQEFMTGDMEFLGLAGCRVDFTAGKHFFPYFDLSVKTDGWIAGNEYLESNVSFKAGVSLRF
jgi:hypothetical protein